MKTDSTGQIGEFFELLLDQINISIAVISRPVVQQQILAFLSILLVSWVVFKGIQILWNRRHAFNDELKIEGLLKNNHWLAAIYHLLTPALALIFLYISLAWVAYQGFPNSLLNELTKINLVMGFLSHLDHAAVHAFW